MTALMWFRRDLRLADNPALVAAAESGEVLPFFVLDPTLTKTPGRRLDRLKQSLASLHKATDGALVVRTGDPASVVPTVAEEVGAESVHISMETNPYGRRRDRKVYEALGSREIALVGTGSPYAVTPGRIQKGDGSPFKVFTPFSKAWRSHGWRAPAGIPPVEWHAGVTSESLTDDPRDVGERAALKRWHAWHDEQLEDYGSDRNRPDLDSTSRLSVFLKYGEIHPRTILADLVGQEGSRFVTELCWREFYADVMFHNPTSSWKDLRSLGIDYEDPKDMGEEIAAWKRGETGYPIVDAGMRQLLDEGWMHNRVRMITASFLTKDLHVPWQVGARHFMDQLLDGDLSSNAHGWQWVAGTGTDAAPYFRVFNPTLQGQKFDPKGDYVRRWIPELAHLEGDSVHEPWKHDEDDETAYPARIVDHHEARSEALARYERRNQA